MNSFLLNIALFWDRLGATTEGILLRTGMILLPICFLAVLKLRKNSVAYIFFCTIGILLASAGMLILIISVSRFGSFWGFIILMPHYYVPHILLFWFFISRFRQHTIQISKMVYAAAIIITAFLYYGLYAIEQYSRTQHIVLQVTDLKGNKLEQAQLIEHIRNPNWDTKSLGQTNSLGRVVFSIDTRKTEYSSKYTISKPGYQSVDIFLQSNNPPRPALDLFRRNLISSTSYNETVNIPSRLDIAYVLSKYTPFMGAPGTTSDFSIPQATYMVMTVILPPEGDDKKPNYSRAIFGELLSDEDEAELNVANFMPSEEDLGAADVLERLKKQGHYWNSFAQQSILDLSNTIITDKFLTSIVSLTANSLVRLDLSNTAITDNALSSLPPLPALRILDLSGTQVTGTGLTNVSFPLLQELILSSRTIDEGLAAMAVLPSLEKLYITDTITEAGLSDALFGLANGRGGVRDDNAVRMELSKQIFQNFPRTYVTDAGIINMKIQPKLEWLDLNYTEVSGISLDHLSQFPNLLVAITDTDSKCPGKRDRERCYFKRQ